LRDVAISRPVALETVQSALRQDSADLLYYHLTDAGIILIHVGPDSFHARNVFLPRFLVTSKVGALVDSMRKKGFPFREDMAKELFLYLVQPAMGWLSTDHLIVIPQAELQALPFQALMDPADGTFVGERFQVTYAPSAWILLQLKKQRNLAGGSLLAASEPSLQSARKEVNAVASLYPERSKVLTDSLIRKADFKQWAGSYDIIHLAVHGKFDAEEPLLSKVKLAPGAGEEGDLTAAEMFGLPLEKTRLVTLSACETGRVRTTRSNEIQGIQQALLFAGAQSLLVSAWQVDDDATSIWMQTFYREAQTKTPAEAAREAIRTVRRDARYTHPFYWAPFVLVAR
jgi:CHAT domain-containing protein